MEKAEINALYKKNKFKLDVDDPELECTTNLIYYGFILVSYGNQSNRGELYREFVEHSLTAIRFFEHHSTKGNAPQDRVAIVKDGAAWVNDVRQWVNSGLFGQFNPNLIDDLFDRQAELIARCKIMSTITIEIMHDKINAEKPAETGQTYTGIEAWKKFIEKLSEVGNLEIPLYPFKAGKIKYLNFTDKPGYLKYGSYRFSKDDCDVIENTVGFPLTISKLRAFLVKNCSVQDPIDYSWPDIIAALSLYRNDLASLKPAEIQQRQRTEIPSEIKLLDQVAGELERWEKKYLPENAQTGKIELVEIVESESLKKFIGWLEWCKHQAEAEKIKAECTKILRWFHTENGVLSKNLDDNPFVADEKGFRLQLTDLLRSIEENIKADFAPEQPAETKGDTTPAKRWRIVIKKITGWIFMKTSHLIGTIIAGLIVAVLIYIFGEFGWLERIKAFIEKIPWPE